MCAHNPSMMVVEAEVHNSRSSNTYAELITSRATAAFFASCISGAFEKLGIHDEVSTSDETTLGQAAIPTVCPNFRTT